MNTTRRIKTYCIALLLLFVCSGIAHADGFSVSLKNGDLDGDNEITTSDLSIVICNLREMGTEAFSGTRTEAPETGPYITGTVNLDAWASEDWCAQQEVEVRAQPTNDNTIYYWKKFTSGTAFQMYLPSSGTYNVQARRCHWLRADTTASTGGNPFTLTLKNGDVDMDNEVSIIDESIVIYNLREMGDTRFDEELTRASETGSYELHGEIQLADLVGYREEAADILIEAQLQSAPTSTVYQKIVQYPANATGYVPVTINVPNRGTYIVQVKGDHWLRAQATAGTIIYVNKATGSNSNSGRSWDAAKQTVAAGLNAAVSGEEVWVAANTYTERITLKEGVKLYGGFSGTEVARSQRSWTANPTILDGSAGGTVVTSPSGVTSAACIDGFTIRNGSASNGGGIVCTSSSPTIENDTVTGNSASYGGGIYCSASSSPMVKNNTITGNSASNGGGIYCTTASAAIENNIIHDNSAENGCGGGLYALDSTLAIAGNVFMKNKADSGGAIYSTNTGGQIANNTAISNLAGSGNGGGIYVNSGSPTLSNNIIICNTGHGIYHATGSLTFQKNDVWGNTGYSYSWLTTTPFTPPGTDLEPVDPAISNIEWNDWHIAETSPCVNQGASVSASPILT
jgi:parallel beta-helix repeat protein